MKYIAHVEVYVNEMPMQLTRNVWVMSEVNIADLMIDIPLPPLITFQDTLNEYDFKSRNINKTTNDKQIESSSGS